MKLSSIALAMAAAVLTVTVAASPSIATSTVREVKEPCTRCAGDVKADGEISPDGRSGPQSQTRR